MNSIDTIPSNRMDAIKAGVSHYFTGKPCKHGHVASRSTKSRDCSECHVERMRASRLKNPERAREIARASLSKNRMEVNRRRRESYHRDIDESRRKQRERRKQNPEKFRERDAKYRSVTGLKVHRAISEGIRRSLPSRGKAGRSSFKVLGYTRDKLMKRLESQFSKGMSWSNYGEGGWEIDHIIPVSAFNFVSSDNIDFKKCWALRNLRPMWNVDNKSKGAKLMNPFQPSLALPLPANDNTSSQAVTA